MNSVSVITVNFNQDKATEALLGSILNGNGYANLEIIVVDNGSTIDPVPGWILKYPAVRFIRSEINLGFAGGNNLGIKKAAGEYLFFVNNDTEFTDGLVAQLAGTMDRHPGVGMISPKIRYYSNPDILQYAGFTQMNYYTARNRCIGQFEKDEGQYDRLTGETGYIHGAAMMVRRAAITRAGPMPEIFFLYYEEIDWCERIKRAGYKIWADMQALIYHKESLSVGSNSALKEYFMNRNRVLFIRRNCNFFVRSIFWTYFIFIVMPRNVMSYIKNKQVKFIPVFFKAIAWNFANSPHSTNPDPAIKNIR